MKAGIAPTLLAAQVENTAPWLRADPRAAAPSAVLAAAGALEEAWRRDPAEASTRFAYLRLLLTAHFATVATFVPTDVDARIRHHAWASMDTPEEIARACDVVDEVAAWDATWVSARVVVTPGEGRLSGHDGEWLGVRAGALGRAAAIGAEDLVERLVADLDREVDRHARVLDEALAGGSAERLLSIATIVAHDLGDLSRVVAAWPGGADAYAALRAKYTRLGHADAAPSARRASFVTAGELNKAFMALENHRFLALRKPRALRASRDLLLPIGPWFDAWGEALATHPALDERDRAEVVTALLEIHASSPDQLGCLRALAGVHRATRGGLELYVPHLPARIRRDALRGRVREALDVPKERFEARIEKRLAAVRRAPAHPR